jgi:hypothetical protein
MNVHEWQYVSPSGIHTTNCLTIETRNNIGTRFDYDLTTI